MFLAFRFFFHFRPSFPLERLEQDTGDDEASGSGAGKSGQSHSMAEAAATHKQRSTLDEDLSIDTGYAQSIPLFRFFSFLFSSLLLPRGKNKSRTKGGEEEIRKAVKRKVSWARRRRGWSDLITWPLFFNALFQSSKHPAPFYSSFTFF